jgi:hypothetical protein
MVLFAYREYQEYLQTLQNKGRARNSVQNASVPHQSQPAHSPPAPRAEKNDAQKPSQQYVDEAVNTGTSSAIVQY